MSQHNSRAVSNNGRDGERGSGEPGGSRFFRSRSSPECPSAGMPLQPLGVLPSPHPSVPGRVGEKSVRLPGTNFHGLLTLSPPGTSRYLRTNSNSPVTPIIPCWKPFHGSPCPWDKIPSPDRDAQTLRSSQASSLPHTSLPAPLDHHLCLSNSVLT